MNTKTSHRSPARLLAALLAIGLVAALPAAAQATAEELQNSGLQNFQSGKYLEAAKDFQALVDTSPGYAFGYFMLGVSFAKTSKYEDAEKNFKKAIELKGDEFRYHFNLANVYQIRQQWGKVVATLSAAERLAGAREKLPLHKVRGFALAQQKKWGEAIDDLEKAKSMRGDADTLTQLGKAYFAVGENQKAVSNLRAALAKDPNAAESHQLMAEALLQMAGRARSDAEKSKHYREAMKEAQAFVRAKPSLSAARYLLGRAALGATEYRSAIDEFNKVLEKQPDNCNAMANMGAAFIGLKDWNNALASLDNATACSPGMGVAWEQKGFALQKQKRFDEAVTSYTKALQLRPDSTFAKKGIETCKQNKDVLSHNEEIALLEKQQEEEARRAQEEYEREKKKAEEWNKRDDQ